MKNKKENVVHEASEIILLAPSDSKAAKYIAALWYFEHINSTIANNARTEDRNGATLLSISAGKDDEIFEGAQLLVTSNTLISYVVRSYGFVFVIDISPSMFIVDGAAGCVPHFRIINRLRQCLQGLVERDFLPSNIFLPELFITICFYSPFIAFDDDRVILQGSLLTKENVSSIIHYVEERLAVFSNRLCWTMRPHLRRWNQDRKKAQRGVEDLLPESFFRQQSHTTDTIRDSLCGHSSAKLFSGIGSADEGFINSEWSLMFMLRAGLIGLQMLPESAQSNLVVITDAVCHVTDVYALQKLMTQLRNHSVACSFIQVQEDCNMDMVFGHFSSPEFFVFLAKATSGVYLPHTSQNSLDGAADPVDSKPLLCKPLQLLRTLDNYIKDLTCQISPEFVELYTVDVVRRLHYSMEYESALGYLLRLRFCEGFVLKNVVEKKGDNESLFYISLSLLWKPQVTIDYKILASCKTWMERTKLKITVVCEAPYGIIRDLLSDRYFSNLTKQNLTDAYRHTIFGLFEADRMLIHIHSFNSLPDLYLLPSDVLKERPLFRYILKGNKAVLRLSTRELETLCSQNITAANFVEFWRIITEFEEGLWQKWSQVYTFRIILTHDHPLPVGLFLVEEPTAKVTSQLALTAFHNMLLQMSTFSLVYGQTYVKFFGSDNHNDKPKSFCIIKINLETPFVVMKLAFLDGLTDELKENIIKDYRRNLASLSIERSHFYTKVLDFADVRDDYATVAETMQVPALRIINRPLEIFLARYKKVPLVTYRIIRLEKEEAVESNRDLILHNSIAKYLTCGRFIWYLKKAFPLSPPITCLSADFILHTVLQRRLNEGFCIAYGDNGIVTLIRHVDDVGRFHCGSALLQYIIFPPTTVRAMRITKELMDKMPSLCETVEVRANEPKKSVSENSTLKTDVDLQLMTELWSEPLAVTDAESITLAERQLQQIRNADEDIICTLSTLDQMMSLCTHQYSSSHFTLTDSRDSSEHRKCEHLTTSVEIIPNCFCIQSLLKNAKERELLLLPTLSYLDDDPTSSIRLQILLECLHCELANASNVTVEIRNSNFWLEITRDIDQSILKRPPKKVSQKGTADDSFFCPTRIYLSRLSPWRIIIIACLVNPQHILSATSRIIPTIPLLVFHCDEPWIAHHLAQTEPWKCETCISDHRTKSPTSTLAHLNQQIRKVDKPPITELNKTDELELHWLSTARISATENRVHTSFDLHYYCETIEDQLFSRALISSIYRSLLEGIHVPYEDLVEVLEDRCEQTDIEVKGIDECIRFLCSHVANIRKEPVDSATNAEDEARSNGFFKDDVIYRLNSGEPKACEEEQEDFRIAFNELLSQNFRKIPNYPTYFYFVRESGTHLGNQDLMINPREAKNSTSFNSHNKLEICRLQDEDETKFDDSCGSNKSSISFESVSMSNSPDGEALLSNDITAVPLFLNFSCSIRFSNMEMRTFPIDHMPTCVMELLGRCSNLSERNFAAVDIIGITFDIYVLSWPTVRITMEQSESYSFSPKNLDKSPVLHTSSNYFNFDRFCAASTSDVIGQLPYLENEAVRRLKNGITRLLHMETMLVLSRYDDVTVETLEKVMRFTGNKQYGNSDPNRIRRKVLQPVMVVDQMKAFRRLKERVKNFHLLYCKLETLAESTNLFYCCRVSDIDLYESTLSRHARALTRMSLKSARRSTSSFTEPIDDRINTVTRTKASSLEVINTVSSVEKPIRKRSSSVPVVWDDADVTPPEDYTESIAFDKTVYNDYYLRDFWIVINFKKHKVQVFFCERYAHHHEKVFEYLLEAIRRECRFINQELLLEKMYATNECDSLLIESDTVSHNIVPVYDSILDKKRTRFSVLKQRSIIKNEKNVSFCDSDEEIKITSYKPAHMVYPPGHFACRVVAHHWFYIHPRLHSELRGKGCSLMMGYDTLRQGIEQFAVRNRRNLYVYCEENKRNIFYIQLFVNEESFKERCLRYDASITIGMEDKFQKHVLLTAHGVHEPGTVFQSIIDTMQKRLDLRVLEELTSTLHKNPHTRLAATDVEFIQRDPARPFAVHYCTLPNYIYGYLGSLYYYMFQQMLTFTTEARFRDYSGSSRNFPYERSHFHSQPGSCSVCDNYVPHFYLINKPPTKGSSNLGIACVETRIVDCKGACINNLKYAPINSSTYAKLYPWSGKNLLSSSERFHDLTRCITTSLPLPDSLLPEKPGGVCFLVQYTIWQVGDVGLSTLQPRFRLALQQALCDLVTEFGLLGVPILESISVRTYLSKTYLTQHTTWEHRNELLTNEVHSHAESQLLSQPDLLPYQIMHKLRSPMKVCVKYAMDSADRQNLIPKHGADTRHGNNDGSDFTTAINRQFVAVAAQWFDHVVSEVKNTEHQFSVKKFAFHCESDHSVQKIFCIVRDKLCGILCYESVAICQLEARSMKRFSTPCFPSSVTSTFISDNGRIVTTENEEPSLILIAYNREYFEEILNYGADSRSNIIPAAVEKVLRDPKANAMRFLPQIAPFVPRQHLLYLISKGGMVTLYLYNYTPDAADLVQKMVADVLSWQNARARLLREIGLHKMGITHLSGRITPSGELVWLNSELLSEYEIPQYGSVHFDKRLVSSSRQYIQAEPLMHLYRYTTLAFLPLNLRSNNLFEDQCLQMVLLEKEMKLMLNDCEQFYRIHCNLLKNICSIKEFELLRIISCSREVHFVRSPLLLFPKWRKMVAAVRRASENAVSFRQLATNDSTMRRASGPKISHLESISLLTQTRSTRSNTFSTTTLRLFERASRKLTRNSETDEPCCLKIQFMLVESYVNYLKKQGLRLLDVITVDAVARQSASRYSLHYNIQHTELSPSIWMFKACSGGILFVHVTISEPHFSVRYLLWNMARLNRLKIKLDQKFNYDDQKELELLQSDIISKSHVHSFTYDFHLRMVATYLIGGQQVLFNYGYNTNEFLVDFLQYYKCRPPYARNCIYEEKMELPNLPITNQKAWEYLLDEKCSDWRVVRLKPTEMDMSGQFMIVSENAKDCFGVAYKEIRVVVCENQCQPANTLVIKFYVILVSHEKTDPLIENSELDAMSDDFSKMDEFKELKNAHGDNTDKEFSNAESTIMIQKARIFRSAENIGPAKELEFPRKFSSAIELGDCLPKKIREERKITVENTTPLRHHKAQPVFQACYQASDVLVNRSTKVPREQAFYICDTNLHQMKLQEELESSALLHKQKLQMVIKNVIWHCQRDQLWNDMIEKHGTKRETLEMNENRKLLSNHSSEVAVVLRTALSTSLTATDLDNLLNYIKSESLNVHESLLDSLIDNLNPGVFFKQLIQHFGAQKCRLFCSSNREHLVILTAEAQRLAFLFTVQNDEPVQMKLLVKECPSTKCASLLMEANSSIRKQFEEIVRCVASFVWMNLTNSSLTK